MSGHAIRRSSSFRPLGWSEAICWATTSSPMSPESACAWLPTLSDRETWSPDTGRPARPVRPKARTETGACKLAPTVAAARERRANAGGIQVYCYEVLRTPGAARIQNAIPQDVAILNRMI
jgi:hypothetical protein